MKFGIEKSDILIKKKGKEKKQKSEEENNRTLWEKILLRNFRAIKDEKKVYLERRRKTSRKQILQ